MSDESELEQLLKSFQKALDTLNRIGDVESLVTKVDAKKNRKLLKKVKTVVSDVHNKVSTIKDKFSSVYNKTKSRNNNSDKDGSNVNKKSISDKEPELLLDSNSGDCSSPIIGTKHKHSKKPSAPATDPETTSVEGNEQQTKPTQCNGHLEGQGQSPESTPQQQEACRVMLDRMSIDDDNDKQLEESGETNVNADSSIKASDGSGAIADENEVTDENEKNNQTNATQEKNNANGESSEEIIETTPSKPSILKLTLSTRKTQDETNQDISEIEIIDSASETEDNNEADKEENENDNSGEQSEKKDDNLQSKGPKKKLEESAHINTKEQGKKNNEAQESEMDKNAGEENEGSVEDDRGSSKKNNEAQENEKDENSGEESEGSDVVDIVDGDDTAEEDHSKTDEEDNEGSVGADSEKNKRSDGDGKSDDLEKEKNNKEIVISEEDNADSDGKENSKIEAKKSKNHEEECHKDKDQNETGGENETEGNEKSNTEEDQNKESPEKEPETSEKPLVPRIKLVDINKLLAPNKKPMDLTPTPGNNDNSMPFEEPIIVLTSSDDDVPIKKIKEKSTAAKKPVRQTRTVSKVVDLSDSDSDDGSTKRTRQKSKKKDKRLSSGQSSYDSDFGGTTRSRRMRNRKKGSSDFTKLIQKRRARKFSYGRKIYTDDSSDEESRKATRKSKRVKRRSSTSDSDDDWLEKSHMKNNTKKRKRKKRQEQISLSDESDYSGKHSNKAKTNHIEPDKDDPKFSMEVSIRLPKFKCEELVRLCKKDKELFAVKRLPKVSGGPKKKGASKNSDDSGKPKSKKLKLALKSNRTESEDEHVADDADKNKTNQEMDEDIVILDESPDAAASTVAETAETTLEQADKEGEKNSEDEQAKKDENHDEKEDVNEQAKGGTDQNDDESAMGSGEGEQEKLAAPTKVATTEISVSDSEEDTSKTKANSDEDPAKENETDKEAPTNSASDDEEAEKQGDKDISSEEESNPNKTKEKDKEAAAGASSDSDDDFTKFPRKNIKSKKELAKSEAKKKPKNKLISDSDSDADDKSETNDNDADDTKDKDTSANNSEKDSEKSEAESEKSNKPARKRIKRVKDSSSDDEDKSTRKQIRKMIDRDSLSETTKKAEQEEKERKARIAEKQRKYNQIFELKADATVDKVVLDFDEKTDKPLLSVHKKLVKHLKPHQVQGVKFMWDTCFESLDRAKNTAGSGCILAHCMGLGKTLQVIALVHTLLTNQSKTNVERVLVVCPVSTVLNWKNEFKKWMPKQDEFEIYELVSCKTTSINHERSYVVKCWHEDGGVLIIGYNMFRTLSNPQNKSLSKKLRESFQKGLVDPGPDLVVCDEGHLLKNEKSNLSIAMNRIKSARRIVLTGTPLQNNLREYWCMVQFIKPNLLGTYKEYLNRFVNPITNGQYTDSTQHDIMVMRRRSHVLHKLLNGVVQRQDYSVLEPYLPPKYEYVVFLKLTDIQVKLYKHYMDNLARREGSQNKTSVLFNDFQQLQRICTHPKVLLDKSIRDQKKEKLDDESESEGSLKDFIDDDTSTSASSSSSSGSEDGFVSDDSAEVKASNKGNKKTRTVKSRKTRMTRAAAADKRKNGLLSDNEEEEEEQKKEWWEDYISKDELDDIKHSSKLFLLFQILKECEDIGDKILIFSQSLYTLNCIEYFLEIIDQATQKGEAKEVGGHSGSWSLGLDYFRLDGSSSCDDRASWCDQFNDPDNTRARLFLISTRAGGLGINLVAANRVIIFDVSWNPSHDIQSIYRVYRFGQTKPAYIYRFVTYGTMEMKIYERQVTKQAISKRVIDEQQIDRHYSQHDIMELYNTDLEPSDRPIPMVPKDVLLGEMLQKHENTIFKYHEHQSLLENKQDEELNEEERKAAWDEFENEKVMRKTTIANFGGLNSAATNLSPQLIQMALANIVRKDNPTWPEIQIKGIIPALASQLQVQMSENDFSMYNRVQQEIRLMQALHNQRMREIYLKQYQTQMQQKLTHDMLGNMNISPEEIRRLQMAQNILQAPTTSAAVASGDVIELND